MNKNLERAINNKIEHSQAILDKLSENILTNPAYTLRWSDNAFQAATDLREYNNLKINLSYHNIENLKKILDFYIKDTLNKATNKSSSTSKTANMIEDCERVSIANICELLQHYT